MNAQMSKGIVSDETILENHPFVDDVEKEKQRIQDEMTLINFDEEDEDNLFNFSLHSCF